MNRYHWLLSAMALLISALSAGMLLIAALGWPLWVSMVPALATAWLLWKVLPAPEHRTDVLLLAGCLGIACAICWQVRGISPRQGGWDAWAMWNPKAALLAAPGGYHALTHGLAPSDHPDYPLGLPGLLAFLFRIAGTRSDYHISFGVSLFAGVALAVWVFTALYQHNRLVGFLALLFFCLNEPYLTQIREQYADTWVALYITGAAIVLSLGRQWPAAPVVAGALAGTAACFKNEGLLLALLLAACYGPRLVRHRQWKGFGIAMAIPLLVLLCFKAGIDTPNDLISGQGTTTLAKLLDAARYGTIWRGLQALLSEHYAVLVPCTLLLWALPALRRRRPSPEAWLFTLAMGCYFMVYVVTPQDLEWHLLTSQNRLLHQLVPLAVFGAGRELARFIGPDRAAA